MIAAKNGSDLRLRLHRGRGIRGTGPHRPEAGGDPPTVRAALPERPALLPEGRPLRLRVRLRPRSNATDDPADSWHAYWASSQSAAPARHGFCTTEVVERLTWSGPAKPTRTFPALGSSKAGPAVGARLMVDAAGHARTVGELQQTPTWPAGLVTTTGGAGRLTVLWQGATTRGMSLAFGAEVVNPAGAPNDFGGDQYELGVPCAQSARPARALRRGSGPPSAVAVTPPTFRCGFRGRTSNRGRTSSRASPRSRSGAGVRRS